MTLQLLKKNDLTTTAWKNGGGATSEVAIFPSHATLAEGNFDWRVSIATVATNGPFSTFPDYDRSLVIWKGEGLLINSVEKRRFNPFHFRGEDLIEAELIAGSVQDLGVIARRSLFTTEILVEALREEGSLHVKVQHETFMLCASGEIRVGEFYLNPGDVVRASGVGEVFVKALEASHLMLASIREASR